MVSISLDAIPYRLDKITVTHRAGHSLGQPLACPLSHKFKGNGMSTG